MDNSNNIYTKVHADICDRNIGKTNVRNISVNMFDPENLPSKSKIICVNPGGCVEIIRNLMTKNGA